MREEKNMKVVVIDEDHILIGGDQFISFRRFTEVKKSTLDEMKILNDKNKEFAEENEALKVLLKNQLNNDSSEDMSADEAPVDPYSECTLCKNDKKFKINSISTMNCTSRYATFDLGRMDDVKFCPQCGRKL